MHKYLLLFICLISANESWSSTININFEIEGNITQSTCILNERTHDQTIQFGDFNRDSFLARGTIVEIRPFEIAFSNCPIGSENQYVDIGFYSSNNITEYLVKINNEESISNINDASVGFGITFEDNPLKINDLPTRFQLNQGESIFIFEAYLETINTNKITPQNINSHIYFKVFYN